MTHEIKQLFKTAAIWQQKGKKSALATVVNVEGSSYRKSGVRMLLSETGETIGAVSGGCIEKEIQHQTKSVFQTGKAKMMTYDGRLRLGCEGILYILIEPLYLSEELIELFNHNLKNRLTFKTESYYVNSSEENLWLGTQLILSNKTFSLYPDFIPSEKENRMCFTQSFPPLFQLYIFGAEHDAAELCKAAYNLGWEITIIADPNESKTLDYFPEAIRLITPTFNSLDTSSIDNQTAIILMTHSFNKDVQYLFALKDVSPTYFGLLGSSYRRERILTKLLEYYPDISTEFLEQLYAPAGLNIGAESPSEIAISILSEILSVIRNQNPIALRDKIGSIHG